MTKKDGCIICNSTKYVYPDTPENVKTADLEFTDKERLSRHTTVNRKL